MGVISRLRTLKKCMFPSRSDLGSAGKNCMIGVPTYITKPKFFHMEDNTVIRLWANILNNDNENIYIKKYSVISTHCTIVTNNHHSTVGVPQCLLGASHVNDTAKDLTIGEDVYVGTNVTILEGADLGRGCIVGACSIVTKPVPPYALVVGSPARIVGVKFTIDQILEHEKALYPASERMGREELDVLFEKYYNGLKVFGLQTEFSEEDMANISIAKRQRHFIEPEL